MKSEDRPPLGSITLLALGVNGIVGVGIFVAPPIVARAFPGVLGALVYLAIAVACLPIALTYARLARAYPRDGGPALYAERAYGRRVSFAIGSMVWVSAIFSTAAVTRGLAEQLAGGRWAVAVAIAISLALAVVNLRGLRASAWGWTLLTVAKLAPMIALVALGVLATSRPHAPAASTGPRGAALLAVLFALQGFEIVPLPAGQARDPERSVPRATVGALLVAGGLYAAVHLACDRALPALSSSTSPLPEAAVILGGQGLSRAIAFGVVASMAGIVVGMHAMTPRYLAAFTLGDRPTPGTPTRAIAASAVLVSLLCAVSSLPELLDLSSIAVLAQYATTALSLLSLSRRPGAGIAPREAWPAPLSLVVVAVLLAHASARELAISAAVAAVSIALAYALARSPSRAP
ncbi:MAG: APC family permease [Deltaproteobacteria bacterium]|nr:APC family permease [Deltaproteobacteria bacterium]